MAAGRLMTALFQPSRDARVTLFAQRTSLLDRILELSTPLWRNHCQTELEPWWTRALTGDPTDSRLRQDFSDLASIVDLSWKIQKLEEEVDLHVTDPKVREGIKTDLTAAGAALMSSNFDDASNLLSAATLKRNKLSQSPHILIAAAAPGRSSDELCSAVKADVNHRKLSVARQGSKPRRAVATVLQFFSGIDTTETLALQYWFVRPLLHIVLLSSWRVMGFGCCIPAPSTRPSARKASPNGLDYFCGDLGLRSSR